MRSGILQSIHIMQQDRPLLIITNKMFDYLAKYGEMAEDRYLIANALGIPIDDPRLSVVHSMQDSYPDHVLGGIIVCGSKSMPTDAEPWIPKLTDFLKREIGRKTPILGICFGHQLIASICGATVTVGAQGREFGIQDVTLTEAGQNDPLFKDIPATFPTAHNHYHTVIDIPKNSDLVELATSEQYRFQSFAIGDTIRTVQFHPETSRELIERYTDDEQAQLLKEGTFENEEALRTHLDTIQHSAFESFGRQILRNFIEHYIS